MGEEAVELICKNAQKTKQNETISLWPLLSTKIELILMKVSKKVNFGQKNIFDLVMSMVQIQMYILTNPCCFANFEIWHKYMLDLDHISIIQIIIDIEEHQPLCKM